MAVFALTHVYGPNWDPTRPRREQEAWDEHAAFMDGLVEDGFVILGGPIGDGDGSCCRGGGRARRQARLAADPWKPMGILEIGSIEPWTIWLDGRQRAPDVR